MTFRRNGTREEATCTNNDKDIMEFQTEPEKDSTYDIPKSSMPQRSNNAYSVVVKSSGQRPVAGEISDREYVAMSVSSKGGMEIDHENDLYVLPSDVQGASGGVETNMIEQGGNKVTHTYSNISMGPYENV
uniref:Uncharacterized protein n=1 Tax=Pinctada fucata TaxID=50426 RepID=A0A194AN94_PINFU